MKTIIAGAGAVGTHLARMLSVENINVILIDGDEERLSKVNNDLDIMTLAVEPTSIEGMKNAGIDNADLFIAVTPDESENIACAMMARQLGAKRTVARIDNYEYMKPENRKIFDYRSFSSDSLLHVHTLGLSATPECAEYDSILKPALGDEIYRYGFEEGVKGHTINSYRLGQIALSFTAQELARYDGITSKMNAISRQLREEYPSLKALHPSAFFQLIRHLASEEEELPAQYLSLAFLRAGISQNASARISCSAALIRLLDPQEQILIFCERISQAEELYHRFHNSGYGKTVRYHSGLTKELRHISLDQFQTGEARILISCKALDEGVDVPAVNIGIVLSCTAQSRQRIQRLGRILRKNAKNNSAVLYYLHVKESADDSAYLPDRTDPSRIFSLEYSLSEDSFLNHAYEAQAANLWAEAMERFPNEADKLEELRSCLIEGLVRQDWMETVSYCNDKILHVSNQHARNYWICMKRISASRTSTSDHSKSVS